MLTQSKGQRLLRLHNDYGSPPRIRRDAFNSAAERHIMECWETTLLIASSFIWTQSVIEMLGNLLARHVLIRVDKFVQSRPYEPSTVIVSSCCGCE